MLTIDLRNYVAHETLKDGTTVIIRAVREDDAHDILDAFKNLDRDSVYRRFFSPKRELTDAELGQLTKVDFRQVVALVVTKQGDGLLIGGGRYAAMPSDSPRSAELAFLTRDDYQGRGIAGLLLRHLVGIAREANLSRFEADVLAENQPMLNVFRGAGLPMAQRRDGNVIHVTLSLKTDANPKD